MTITATISQSLLSPGKTSPAATPRRTKQPMPKPLYFTQTSGMRSFNSCICFSSQFLQASHKGLQKIKDLLKEKSILYVNPQEYLTEDSNKLEFMETVINRTSEPFRTLWELASKLKLNLIKLSNNHHYIIHVITAAQNCHNPALKKRLRHIGHSIYYHASYTTAIQELLKIFSKDHQKEFALLLTPLISNEQDSLFQIQEGNISPALEKLIKWLSNKQYKNASRRLLMSKALSSFIFNIELPLKKRQQILQCIFPTYPTTQELENNKTSYKKMITELNQNIQRASMLLHLLPDVNCVSSEQALIDSDFLEQLQSQCLDLLLNLFNLPKNTDTKEALNHYLNTVEASLLIDYAIQMKNSGENEDFKLVQKLAHFAILDPKGFHDWRYNTDQSKHLQLINKRNPTVLKKWSGKITTGKPADIKLNLSQSNGRTQTWTIKFTDQLKYLLSHTSAFGNSCLGIPGGDTDFSRALIYRIMTGQSQLITAIQGDSKARCLLYLGIDNNDIAILKEKTYQNSEMPTAVKQSMSQLAQQVAQWLDLPLIEKTSEKKLYYYPTIHFINESGIEYVDSLHNLMQGPYSIPECSVTWTPTRLPFWLIWLRYTADK